MKRIEPGSAVLLTYSITDSDGTVIEQRDVPVSYVHGGGSDLFDSIEQALEGKCAGDRVTVSLAPGEGFGDYDPSLTFTDDLDNVPEPFRVIGAEVEMANDQGQTRLFRVTRIEQGRLTVDGNHPFAGQRVTFHVTVVDVGDPAAAPVA